MRTWFGFTKSHFDHQIHSFAQVTGNFPESCLNVTSWHWSETHGRHWQNKIISSNLKLQLLNPAGHNSFSWDSFPCLVSWRWWQLFPSAKYQSHCDLMFLVVTSFADVTSNEFFSCCRITRMGCVTSYMKPTNDKFSGQTKSCSAVVHDHTAFRSKNVLNSLCSNFELPGILFSQFMLFSMWRHHTNVTSWRHKRVTLSWWLR